MTNRFTNAVSDCFAPDDVLRHAGLVMAHAANIASVLNIGELICPFAVVTKGDSRESIEFEAPTQDEAISEGWASLEKYKEHFDLWAFATTNPSSCANPSGFYFTATDDRQKRLFAMLMAAQLAGRNVRICTTGVCHTVGYSELDGVVVQ